MLDWIKQKDFNENQTVTKETIQHTDTYVAKNPFGNLCLSCTMIDLGNGKSIKLPYGIYFEGNLIDRSSVDYESALKIANDWYAERANSIYQKLKQINSTDDKKVVNNQNQNIQDNNTTQPTDNINNIIVTNELQGGAITDPKLVSGQQ